MHNENKAGPSSSSPNTVRRSAQGEEQQDDSGRPSSSRPHSPTLAATSGSGGIASHREQRRLQAMLSASYSTSNTLNTLAGPNRFVGRKPFAATMTSRDRDVSSGIPIGISPTTPASTAYSPKEDGVSKRVPADVGRAGTSVAWSGKMPNRSERVLGDEAFNQPSQHSIGTNRTPTGKSRRRFSGDVNNNGDDEDRGKGVEEVDEFGLFTGRVIRTAPQLRAPSPLDIETERRRHMRDLVVARRAGTPGPGAYDPKIDFTTSITKSTSVLQSPPSGPSQSSCGLKMAAGALHSRYGFSNSPFAGPFSTASSVFSSGGVGVRTPAMETGGYVSASVANFKGSGGVGGGSSGEHKGPVFSLIASDNHIDKRSYVALMQTKRSSEGLFKYLSQCEMSQEELGKVFILLVTWELRRKIAERNRRVFLGLHETTEESRCVSPQKGPSSRACTPSSPSRRPPLTPSQSSANASTYFSRNASALTNLVGGNNAESLLRKSTYRGALSDEGDRLLRTMFPEQASSSAKARRLLAQAAAVSSSADTSRSGQNSSSSDRSKNGDGNKDSDGGGGGLHDNTSNNAKDNRRQSSGEADQTPSPSTSASGAFEKPSTDTNGGGSEEINKPIKGYSHAPPTNNGTSKYTSATVMNPSTISTNNSTLAGAPSAQWYFSVDAAYNIVLVDRYGNVKPHPSTIKLQEKEIAALTNFTSSTINLFTSSADDDDEREGAAKELPNPYAITPALVRTLSYRHPIFATERIQLVAYVAATVDLTKSASSKRKHKQDTSEPGMVNVSTKSSSVITESGSGTSSLAKRSNAGAMSSNLKAASQGGRRISNFDLDGCDGQQKEVNPPSLPSLSSPYLTDPTEDFPEEINRIARDILSLLPTPLSEQRQREQEEELLKNQQQKERQGEIRGVATSGNSFSPSSNKSQSVNAQQRSLAGDFSPSRSTLSSSFTSSTNRSGKLPEGKEGVGGELSYVSKLIGTGSHFVWNPPSMADGKKGGVMALAGRDDHETKVAELRKTLVTNLKAKEKERRRQEKADTMRSLLASMGNTAGGGPLDVSVGEDETNPSFSLYTASSSPAPNSSASRIIGTSSATATTKHGALIGSPLASRGGVVGGARTLPNEIPNSDAYAPYSEIYPEEGGKTLARFRTPVVGSGVLSLSSEGPSASGLAGDGDDGSLHVGGPNAVPVGLLAGLNYLGNTRPVRTQYEARFNNRHLPPSSVVGDAVSTLTTSAPIFAEEGGRSSAATGHSTLLSGALSPPPPSSSPVINNYARAAFAYTKGSLAHAQPGHHGFYTVEYPPLPSSLRDISDADPKLKGVGRHTIDGDDDDGESQPVGAELKDRFVGNDPAKYKNTMHIATHFTYVGSPVAKLEVAARKRRAKAIEKLQSAQLRSAALQRSSNGGRDGTKNKLGKRERDDLLNNHPAFEDSTSSDDEDELMTAIVARNLTSHSYHISDSPPCLNTKGAFSLSGGARSKLSTVVTSAFSIQNKDVSAVHSFLANRSESSKGVSLLQREEEGGGAAISHRSASPTSYRRPVTSASTVFSSTLTASPVGDRSGAVSPFKNPSELRSLTDEERAQRHLQLLKQERGANISGASVLPPQLHPDDGSGFRLDSLSKAPRSVADNRLARLHRQRDRLLSSPSQESGESTSSDVNITSRSFSKHSALASPGAILVKQFAGIRYKDEFNRQAKEKAKLRERQASLDPSMPGAAPASPSGAVGSGGAVGSLSYSHFTKSRLISSLFGSAKDLADDAEIIASTKALIGQ